MTATPTYQRATETVRAPRDGVVRFEDVLTSVSVEPPDYEREPYDHAEPIEFSTLELTILDGLAKGLSSAEVADRLHYSRQAISYHIGQMMTRGRVRNRTALVAQAYERRVLPLGRQIRVPGGDSRPAGGGVSGCRPSG